MMGYEPHSSYGQRETKRENNGENEFRTTEEIDVFLGGVGVGVGGTFYPVVRESYKLPWGYIKDTKSLLFGYSGNAKVKDKSVNVKQLKVIVKDEVH